MHLYMLWKKLFSEVGGGNDWKSQDISLYFYTKQYLTLIAPWKLKKEITIAYFQNHTIFFSADFYYMIVINIWYKYTQF